MAKMTSEVTEIKNLPNLHNATASFRELSSNYWSPEDPGEYKVGVVVEIKNELYENSKGDKIDLPCMIMLSQQENGSFNTIRNGSKKLVSTLEDAIQSGEILLNSTPLRIEYLGKSKNKTNSFKSDTWSVKPIIL